MEAVRIRFTNPSDVARGFVGLATRTRVICRPSDEFEVRERDLPLLDGLGFPYEILGIEGADHVHGAIRGLAASPV